MTNQNQNPNQGGQQNRSLVNRTSSPAKAVNRAASRKTSRASRTNSPARAANRSSGQVRADSRTRAISARQRLSDKMPRLRSRGFFNSIQGIYNNGQREDTGRSVSRHAEGHLLRGKENPLRLAENG